MASLKAAIRAKCKDCTYDPAAGGTYLQQIEDCTVRRCALWEVRPMTVNTINLMRKNKPVVIDVDGLVAGLDDEMDETGEASIAEVA
jgi:hypothetical protein